MNLIVLCDDDISGNTAVITGRRLQHVLTYIKPQAGDTLRAGMLNGAMGECRVSEISRSRLVLELNLDTEPPKPLPATLILAMPRPKVLNRVLQHASAMGIKRIYIIKTWRVEKSYWETPLLEEDSLREQLIAGLEQGRDTLLPEIQIRRFFKPFAEDELPEIMRGSVGMVFHPVGEVCPRGIDYAVTMAIGPEGGFIPYEIDALQKIGFRSVSLGERILRVETAVPYICGRLF